jgi:hypothetical protein
MRALSPVWFVLACAMPVLAGCNLNRDDPSVIKDLRILAISTTPPEVFYPVHGDPLAYQCQPDLSGIQTSGEVDIQALVLDPAGGGRTLSWTWTFCPSDTSSTNPTERCPTDPAYVIAKGNGDPSKIATHWSLAQTALEELSTQQTCHAPRVCPPTPLLTALGQDALGLCRYGIWLQIGLEVDAADGEQLFGSKLLVLTPVPDDYPKDPAVCPQGPNGGPPAHDNPAPVGLSLVTVPLPTDGGITQVDGGGTYDVRPLPPDGGAQDYCVPDFGGGWARLTETWLFSLMTTGGSFSKQQVGGAGGFGGTGFGATQPGPSTDLTVQWATPIAGGPATFYEVTRDGRGGTSWSSWQLDVVVP